MSKSRRWRFTVPLITLVVMGGLLTPLFLDTAVSPQRQNRRRETPDPVSVLATRARVADVPVYIDGVGTARPAAAVTVRPQVDGQLQKLMFKDGQEVKKGDVLAKIDPATYQAQLDQALAKKAQTRRCWRIPSATWSAIAAG